VYQFREGNVIRSKGLGSAARVTPAQARRAREAFAVGRREGFELPGIRPHTPRGDKFAVAPDAYLSNHADEWSEHNDPVAFGGKADVRTCVRNDAVDPKRHFGTINCRIAKGSFA